MKLLRRLIPILASLFILAAYEELCRQPQWLFWLWGGLVAILLLTQLGLGRKALWLDGVILGLGLTLFHSSIYFFIFFSEGAAIRQIVIGLAIIINLFYLTHVYYYHFRPEQYQVNALQNICGYLNLLSVFGLTSVGFSLILYLSWPAWAISLGVALSLSLLVFQTMWVNKVDRLIAWRFALVAGLAGGEVFWAVSFLPSSNLVNAFILTVVNYVFVNLARYEFNGLLQRAVVWRYVIVSGFVLLLTLVSARWT